MIDAADAQIRLQKARDDRRAAEGYYARAFDPSHVRRAGTEAANARAALLRALDEERVAESLVRGVEQNTKGSNPQ